MGPSEASPQTSPFSLRPSESLRVEFRNDQTCSIRSTIYASRNR